VTLLRRAAIVVMAALVSLWPAASIADITIESPPSLAVTAQRIRNVDLALLGQALARAGLELPSPIQVTLVPEDDPRASSVPDWIVGFALGPHDIVIFPGRVLSYPYDSLESVVRHEVTHLALTTRAGGHPLPRWFHEGVATSVDAGWSVSAQVRLLAALVERPGVAGVTRLFASGTESEARQAYLLSAVLVEDLRRRHGAATPGAIAARMSATTSFERAFELQTGETPDAAATRAWAAYRRWTAWIPAITSASATWALILMLAFVAYAIQLRKRFRRRRQWDEEEGGVGRDGVG
jgi:hypothetical protein